jgi:hypothetical protein
MVKNKFKRALLNYLWKHVAYGIKRGVLVSTGER